MTFEGAEQTGWSRIADVAVSELGDPSPAWTTAQAEADRTVAEQFGTAPAYSQSRVREQRMAGLLAPRRIHPHLVVVERTRALTPNAILPTARSQPSALEQAS